MAEPEQGNTAQHMRDMKVYQAYKHNNRVARILLLRSMRNDIMLHFKRHHSTKVVWDAMKVQYGGTFTTTLR